MKLPYNDFRLQYLPRAEVLCKNIGHPELAEKLCETCFKAVTASPEDVSSYRDINVKLAAIAYSWDTPGGILVQRIYPGLARASNEDLITPDERIKKILPVLKEFYLYDRIIMSLTLLDWKNDQIAQFFNAMIAKFSDDITSATTLADVDQILDRFVKRSTNTILSLLDIEDWFPSLLEHNNNPESGYETWRFLKGLCHESEDRRFARKNESYKDKYGRLRDRWHYGKTQMQKQLEESDFLKTKQVDDHNER